MLAFVLPLVQLLSIVVALLSLFNKFLLLSLLVSTLPAFIVDADALPIAIEAPESVGLIAFVDFAASAALLEDNGAGGAAVDERSFILFTVVAAAAAAAGAVIVAVVDAVVADADAVPTDDDFVLFCCSCEEGTAVVSETNQILNGLIYVNGLGHCEKWRLVGFQKYRVFTIVSYRSA